MAWLEKRRRGDGTKRYRIRERIGTEKVTAVKDVGFWKDQAEEAKQDFIRARKAGFSWDIAAGTTMAEVRVYLKARSEGRDDGGGAPIAIELLCDLYLKNHGPSLKGGVSQHWKSAYRNLECRLGLIKRAWAGREAHTITYLDVRDFLKRFHTVGTTLRYLNTVSGMFKKAAIWNRRGILKPRVKLPPANPAVEWRSEMRPGQKHELPDDRVLAPEEWQRFRPHLSARARAICEIALRRFLRPSDIRKISRLALHDGFIKGLQEKTGEEFSVPVLGDQPAHYDFTNFRREFHLAQVAAGMDYPKDHPLHFTLRSLRRTGATWAYRVKKDLVGVSRMLGHRKTSTTLHYLRIDETDKLAIAQAVDALAQGQETPAAWGKVNRC